MTVPAAVGSVEPQPIPTFHQGIWYRSRLEARWALFLDLVGLPTDYEREAYEIKGVSGTYIPDFEYWDEKLVFLAEVKALGKMGWKEVEKLSRLAKQLDVIGFSFEGLPSQGTVRIYDSTQGYHGTIGRFMDCRRCPGVWFVSGNGDAGFSLQCKCSADQWKDPISSERVEEMAIFASTFKFDAKAS